MGEEDARARRELGLLDSVLVVIGSVVGAGIFLVSGSVAAHVASPVGLLLVWAIGGVVAIAGALSNGELGAMLPRGGGEYVYLRHAYGPAVAFLSGWTSFWIGFPGSIATLAAGFGAVVGRLFGAGSAHFDLAIAITSVVVMTAINAFGLRFGKWSQNALSGAKVIALVALLSIGLLSSPPDGAPPFFASEESPHGIALALIPVLFAYSGWNAATYLAGEMKDPKRDLARALAVGTGACAALYVVVNALFVRALPLERIRTESDVARASVEALLGYGAGACLTPLVAVAILSSLQATVVTGPRIYQAMAEDKLFFAQLGALHPRSRVPVTALVVQALVSIVLLSSGTFDKLLTVTTFALGAFGTLTVGAVFVLRFREPTRDRPFRVPGYPLTPLLFIAGNVWVFGQVIASGVTEAMLGIGGVLLGLPVYYAMKRVRGA